MTGLRRIAVSLLVLAGMWPGIAAAQVQKAGVVTTLEGNVTAARSTAAQPVALRFKDDVFVNDRVVTGDRSLARLLLGGKAVVTVRERSALTITEKQSARSARSSTKSISSRFDMLTSPIANSRDILRMKFSIPGKRGSSLAILSRQRCVLAVVNSSTRPASAGFPASSSTEATKVLSSIPSRE